MSCSIPSSQTNDCSTGDSGKYATVSVTSQTWTTGSLLRVLHYGGHHSDLYLFSSFAPPQGARVLGAGACIPPDCTWVLRIQKAPSTLDHRGGQGTGICDGRCTWQAVHSVNMRPFICRTVGNGKGRASGGTHLYSCSRPYKCQGSVLLDSQL